MRSYGHVVQSGHRIVHHRDPRVGVSCRARKRGRWHDKRWRGPPLPPAAIICSTPATVISNPFPLGVAVGKMVGMIVMRRRCDGKEWFWSGFRLSPGAACRKPRTALAMVGEVLSHIDLRPSARDSTIRPRDLAALPSLFGHVVTFCARSSGLIRQPSRPAPPTSFAAVEPPFAQP